MEIDEREAIIRNNINRIMPIVEYIYKNTLVWRDILNIINNIDVNSTGAERVVAYTYSWGIYITPLYFEQGQEAQQRTLLHELAHAYVNFADPNKGIYEDPHEHPEFISKYAESLKLIGMPVKEPAVWKFTRTIFTPVEPPSQEQIEKEKEGYAHNYYCPVCQDIFFTTIGKFKQAHKHAFK